MAFFHNIYTAHLPHFEKIQVEFSFTGFAFIKLEVCFLNLWVSLFQKSTGKSCECNWLKGFIMERFPLGPDEKSGTAGK